MKFKALLILLAVALPVSASAETKHKAATFDYMRTRLRSKAREDLAQFAKSWRANPVHVRIEGHGLAVDEELSIELGERRAEVVRKFLVKQGVDPSYLEVVGHSRGEPGRYVDLVIR